MNSSAGVVHKYASDGADIDSFIEPIVVFSGERMKLEQEQIPEYFWPVTGKWKMRGVYKIARDRFIPILTVDLDLHKVFVDDEHYNSGHGNAYEKLGIDLEKGATVIVRPDQCMSFSIC